MAMGSDVHIDDVSGMLQNKVLATLATYGADGTVRLSPVWCEWMDGGFNVVVADGDVKARHLKRDDRASLVMYTNVPPYQGIEIRTRARLSLQGAAAVEERLARKYLGDAKAEAWLATVNWDALLVRLEPGELRVWDLSAGGL